MFAYGQIVLVAYGAYSSKPRPALIMQNPTYRTGNSVLVIPFTSQKNTANNYRPQNHDENLSPPASPNRKCPPTTFSALHSHNLSTAQSTPRCRCQLAQVAPRPNYPPTPATNNSSQHPHSHKQRCHPSNTATPSHQSSLQTVR